MPNECTIRITQQLGTLLRSYRKFKKIPQKEFATLLRSYRKFKKIPQKEFAQRVCLCQSRVSYLENHPEAMSFEQLMRWVSVLGLEIKLAIKNYNPPETEW